MSSPSAPRPHDASSVASPSAQHAPQQLMLRRAPKLSVFLIGGALLGVLAALILDTALEPPSDPNFVEESALGFFMVILAIPGLALGALLWLWIDRRSRKKVRTVYAESTTNYDNADFALQSYDVQQQRDHTAEQADAEHEATPDSDIADTAEHTNHADDNKQ